ncbi:prolipoprotein diacylglyceryl transferase [Flavilitoribacter nigricans]|uniref:Diacylglyceryl transferase n=1 Tax=Flavilitoribacter nigricans (strain ATCC 23147 / DSM 23189 / NBRC 102662 / NCIMB 1420 / SS-2) TaxID=1122177 RepID=A0A2D0NF59_FLAN2|nr:prolipoprotein diacylglyceryl transferase family protein [Flavilitoribacter nigricans]PHN07154.1 diacylglyceryl transferase [Flavilitoribacter nigricans DSM 23189 = NBRC 102662]
MEFPLIFKFGAITVSAHLLFELLAFSAGFQYFLRLRRQQEDRISDMNRLWVLVGATAGALIGSRLLGALEDPELFFSGRAGWLYYYQSKTIVGGLLGGLIGVEMTKKMIGEKHSSGDLFTFPLILAMIIGRIGCLSSGIAEPTYGLPSGLPWALDLGDGIPRHPTALYEIVFLLLLWASLRYLQRHYRLVPGAYFQLFMTAYLFYRLLVEFIRPGTEVLWGLNVLQLACIGGLIYYRRVWLRPRSLLLPGIITG